MRQKLGRPPVIQIDTNDSSSFKFPQNAVQLAQLPGIFVSSPTPNFISPTNEQEENLSNTHLNHLNTVSEDEESYSIAQDEQFRQKTPLKIDIIENYHRRIQKFNQSMNTKQRSEESSSQYQQVCIIQNKQKDSLDRNGLPNYQIINTDLSINQDNDTLQNVPLRVQVDMSDAFYHKTLNERSGEELLDSQVIHLVQSHNEKQEKDPSLSKAEQLYKEKKHDKQQQINSINSEQIQISNKINDKHKRNQSNSGEKKKQNMIDIKYQILQERLKQIQTNTTSQNVLSNGNQRGIMLTYEDNIQDKSRTLANNPTQPQHTKGSLFIQNNLSMKETRSGNLDTFLQQQQQQYKTQEDEYLQFEGNQMDNCEMSGSKVGKEHPTPSRINTLQSNSMERYFDKNAQNITISDRCNTEQICCKLNEIIEYPMGSTFLMNSKHSENLDESVQRIDTTHYNKQLQKHQAHLFPFAKIHKNVQNDRFNNYNEFINTNYKSVSCKNQNQKSNLQEKNDANNKNSSFQSIYKQSNNNTSQALISSYNDISRISDNSILESTIDQEHPIKRNVVHLSNKPRFIYKSSPIKSPQKQKEDPQNSVYQTKNNKNSQLFKQDKGDQLCMNTNQVENTINNKNKIDKNLLYYPIKGNANQPGKNVQHQQDIKNKSQDGKIFIMNNNQSNYQKSLINNLKDIQFEDHNQIQQLKPRSSSLNNINSINANQRSQSNIFSSYIVSPVNQIPREVIPPKFIGNNILLTSPQIVYQSILPISNLVQFPLKTSQSQFSPIKNLQYSSNQLLNINQQEPEQQINLNSQIKQNFSNASNISLAQPHHFQITSHNQLYQTSPNQQSFFQQNQQSLPQQNQFFNIQNSSQQKLNIPSFSQEQYKLNQSNHLSQNFQHLQQHYTPQYQPNVIQLKQNIPQPQLQYSPQKYNNVNQVQQYQNALHQNQHNLTFIQSLKVQQQNFSPIQTLMKRSYSTVEGINQNNIQINNNQQIMNTLSLSNNNFNNLYKTTELTENSNNHQQVQHLNEDCNQNRIQFNPEQESYVNQSKQSSIQMQDNKQNRITIQNQFNQDDNINEISQTYQLKNKGNNTLEIQKDKAQTKKDENQLIKENFDIRRSQSKDQMLKDVYKLENRIKKLVSQDKTLEIKMKNANIRRNDLSLTKLMNQREQKRLYEWKQQREEEIKQAKQKVSLERAISRAKLERSKEQNLSSKQQTSKQLRDLSILGKEIMKETKNCDILRNSSSIQQIKSLQKNEIDKKKDRALFIRQSRDGQSWKQEQEKQELFQKVKQLSLIEQQIANNLQQKQIYFQNNIQIL